MSLAACADLVRQADPDRFLATMAAPASARPTLFALYAFNVEVTRAPWVTQEPMIAEMRLQFWRDVLDEIAAGKQPRAHDVAIALSEVLQPSDVPLLDALVAARRWDIYSEAFEDAAHFDAYIAATSGNLIRVAARCLGASEAGGDVAGDVGYASGVANFLRAIPDLEARGRVPLIDGTPQGVRDLAQKGLDALTKARRAKASMPARVAPALFAGWRAGTILRAARDLPERVIEGKLDESEFARRARLIWVSTTGRW